MQNFFGNGDLSSIRKSSTVHNLLGRLAVEAETAFSRGGSGRSDDITRLALFALASQFFVGFGHVHLSKIQRPLNCVGAVERC
jgi:hypothetical protein